MAFVESVIIKDSGGTEADVTASNALKVDGSAVTQPISGTVTASQATAASLNATVVQGTATNLKTQAENYQGGTAVGAANPLQVSLANTGANATAVKVDGSAVTQPVSGTVTAAQATAANLNATVVQGTATNLKTQAENYQGGTAVGAANPLQVSLANTGTNATAININDTSTDLTASISISALSGTSGSITTLNGQGTYVFQLTGTWTATLQVQITVDGTNWLNITDSLAINSHTLGTFSANGNITANGIYQVDCSGLSGIRLIATAFSSGPVTGTARASKSDALTAIEGVTTVTPQTITKGTQGAVGFTTQDLKDAGRTAVRYYAVAAAAGTTTTETAITLTRSSGTSATTTGTSFTPTSGKTFRIQAISFATRGNATATIQTTTFNLRINTAGAVTTTSTPVILSMRSATPATASAWDRILLEIPDGIEIAGDGTLQFGVTAAATYTTNAPTWDVTIIGFEY